MITLDYTVNDRPSNGTAVNERRAVPMSTCDAPICDEDSTATG